MEKFLMKNTALWHDNKLCCLFPASSSPNQSPTGWRQTNIPAPAQRERAPSVNMQDKVKIVSSVFIQLVSPPLQCH